MSKFLIKKYIFDLKILITKIVILYRWERGDITVYQGFLHGNSWKKKNPKYAVSTILAMNGLKGEIGPSILWDTKIKNGVFCAFEPQGELANQLAGRVKLNAGVCTWYLQRKLRKARTEKEVVEFSMAKKIKSSA